MDGFIGVCVLALIGGISSLILSRLEGGASLAIKLGTAVIIMGALVISARDVISELYSVSALLGQVSGYAKIVIKALGIAIIASVSARICRDCSAEGIAGTVELAAKIEIFILCLPLIKEILECATKILNMA